MSQIKKIVARQILDSRGNPTIEVDMQSTCGRWGRAAVPSGASTGTREALELRDGDKSFYLGKSVQTAIKNIQEQISPNLIGMNVFEQSEIDHKMLEIDGTENKSKLGANAMLAVSLANAKLASVCKDKPLYEYLAHDLNCPKWKNEYLLPAPLMNIINGGEHASNGLDIQEFMIIPHKFSDFSNNLRVGVEVFHHLKKVLTSKGYSTNVGDEGGFAPNLRSHEEALDCIKEAVEQAGYKLGEEVSLALDVAGSEFFKDGAYQFSDGRKLNTDEMINYLEKLANDYPIYSIEDGLSEHDKEGWSKLNSLIGDKTLVIGDDLFVTNKKILAEGIEKKQANSILVKVNQIGTLTETFDTLELAFKNDMKAIISHRSGETSDSFIADLAVATGSGHIKTGSASRTDRVEKYNQLLRIEENLKSEAKFYKIM